MGNDTNYVQFPIPTAFCDQNQCVFRSFSSLVQFFFVCSTEWGHTSLSCNRYSDMQRNTSALTDEKLGSYQDFERALIEAEKKLFHKRKMDMLQQQSKQQRTKQLNFFSSKPYGQSVYRFCFGGKWSSMAMLHVRQKFSGNKINCEPFISWLRFVCCFYLDVSAFLWTISNVSRI